MSIAFREQKRKAVLALMGCAILYGLPAWQFLKLMGDSAFGSVWSEFPDLRIDIFIQVAATASYVLIAMIIGLSRMYIGKEVTFAVSISLISTTLATMSVLVITSRWLSASEVDAFQSIRLIWVVAAAVYTVRYLLIVRVHSNHSVRDFPSTPP